MRWGPFFLGVWMLAAGCVVEDKLVADAGIDAGDASACGGCDGDKPVCIESTGTCVQCTVEEDSYCEDRAQICDAESNECTACIAEEGCCVDDSACTSPSASRCDLSINECAACESNTQCDDVDGLDPSGNACDDGVCVDCTPESEADTCADDKSCNPASKECTGTTVGSLEVCDACVADSECGDEGVASDAFRCVPMYYPNQETRFPDDETGFCLKSTDGGCERPYAVTLDGRPTLSQPSSSGAYCGINEALATCPAVAALVADERCPDGTDEECEPSGICRQVGALENRCTYFCSGETQCDEPPNPGSTCGSSGSSGDDYCGG